MRGMQEILTRQHSINISPYKRNAKTVSFSRPPSDITSDATYTQFKVWKESWDNYEMLSELYGCSTRLFSKLYQHRDAKPFEEENMLVKTMIEKIQGYLQKKKNVAIDRVAVLEIIQEHRELFDNCFVSLKKLAEDSELCNTCLDETCTCSPRK